MYSTKSNENDGRYAVRCLMVSHYVTTERFIVDTGAAYTCCGYTIVNKGLKEAQFVNCESKNLCGIVNGVAIKYYKFRLKQFTIGNIDLKEQDIWITFDSRVTDIILGMDMLKQVIVIMNPYNERIYFCKDRSDYNDFELAAC